MVVLVVVFMQLVFEQVVVLCAILSLASGKTVVLFCSLYLTTYCYLWLLLDYAVSVICLLT